MLILDYNPLKPTVAGQVALGQSNTVVTLGQENLQESDLNGMKLLAAYASGPCVTNDLLMRRSNVTVGLSLALTNPSQFIIYGDIVHAHGFIILRSAFVACLGMKLVQVRLRSRLFFHYSVKAIQAMSGRRVKQVPSWALE
jgi:hypothetical protein